MSEITGCVTIPLSVVYVYDQAGQKVTNPLAQRRCAEQFEKPITLTFTYTINLTRLIMSATTYFQGRKYDLFPLGVGDASVPLYFMSKTLNPQIIFDIKLPEKIGNAKLVYDAHHNPNHQCILASQPDNL